ncbi:GldG family protein [Leucothrix arctica]|uniref:ABC transporter n=1 Tax=Leucothrix arctica TaxID=1481894 RepID=A0A317CE89_9GAMM|nr:GldG family protein [Leucothrix arctica]PWQ96697.1 ABC transporter [Leucothrix arctica]
MSIKRPSAFGHHLNQIVFYCLVLGLAGLVAWFSTRQVKITDVTFGQRNTLTAQTQSLLKSIDKPINFVAYLSDEKVNLHAGMKKLVNKYKQFKPDTTLEIIDPNLNPDRAKQDKVVSEGRVIIQLGEDSKKLSSVDENTIANTLQRMLRNNVPRVIMLEGHQERDAFDESGSGLSKLRERLADRGFRLQPHNILTTQSLPKDSSFVVIAAPLQSYLDTEAKVISDYIKTGGNLLWLTEPRTLAGLDSIKQQLGLNIPEGTLLGNNPKLQEMLGIKHPAVMPVIKFSHPLLKDMTTPVLLPFATAIEQDLNVQTDWTYAPLLTTEDQTWLEVGELSGEVTRDFTTGDLPGPMSLAMSMTRQLADKAQRIVVMGDSDFMLNQFIGAANGGNLTLTNKLFDWLSNSDQLLSIEQSRAPDTELKMPGNSLNILSVVFLIGLPLLLILIGSIRWWIRKRR